MALPMQTRGRPRLRCAGCVAAYKQVTRYGPLPRVCRGGCGADLTGHIGVSYCSRCRPPGKEHRGVLSTVGIEQREHSSIPDDQFYPPDAAEEGGTARKDEKDGVNV